MVGYCCESLELDGTFTAVYTVRNRVAYNYRTKRHQRECPVQFARVNGLGVPAAKAQPITL